MSLRRMGVKGRLCMNDRLHEARVETQFAS